VWAGKKKLMGSKDRSFGQGMPVSGVNQNKERKVFLGNVFADRMVGEFNKRNQGKRSVGLREKQKGSDGGPGGERSKSLKANVDKKKWGAGGQSENRLITSFEIWVEKKSRPMGGKNLR